METLKTRADIEAQIAALQQERALWSAQAERAIGRQDWNSLAAHNADTCGTLINALQWVIGEVEIVRRSP